MVFSFRDRTGASGIRRFRDCTGGELYTGATTLRQFDRWFEALFALKRDLIQGIVESVPAEWVVGERCELAKTMEVLFRRRKKFAGLVAESLEHLELQKNTAVRLKVEQIQLVAGIE